MLRNGGLLQRPYKCQKVPGHGDLPYGGGRLWRAHDKLGMGIGPQGPAAGDIYSLEGFAYADDAGAGVDIGPLEGANLADAQAPGEADVDAQVHGADVFPDVAKQQALVGQ